MTLKICKFAESLEYRGGRNLLFYRACVFPFCDASLPQKDANVQSTKELSPLPHLTPGWWSCPRSPEAIRTVSGAHRRDLESGVRLFTPNIARPNSRVLTGEGKGRGERFSSTQLAVRAPRTRCPAKVRCPTGGSTALP